MEECDVGDGDVDLGVVVAESGDELESVRSSREIVDFNSGIGAIGARTRSSIRPSSCPLALLDYPAKSCRVSGNNLLQTESETE